MDDPCKGAYEQGVDEGYDHALKDVADWLRYLYPTALKSIAAKIEINDMTRDEA